jgi:hypothetical protein
MLETTLLLNFIVPLQLNNKSIDHFLCASNSRSYLLSESPFPMSLCSMCSAFWLRELLAMRLSRDASLYPCLFFSSIICK